MAIISQETVNIIIVFLIFSICFTIYAGVTQLLYNKELKYHRVQYLKVIHAICEMAELPVELRLEIIRHLASVQKDDITILETEMIINEENKK